MNTLITRTLILLLLAVRALEAQVPQLINYQGRVAVNGVNFDGSGQFKFALVNGDGTTSYWSNDGTSTAGSEPKLAVAIKVTAGQYSVLLGDASLPNMAAIPPGVLDHGDVFVRVWFNDGTNGSQLLTPDQRLIPKPAPIVPDLPGDNVPAAGDAWLQRPGEAPPTGRESHTAVWTGSEMIVWGGEDMGGDPFNDGGIYNPQDNSWKAVNTINAPGARLGHAAVWTGSEMIVWGGSDMFGGLSDGGRYNPASDSWSAMSAAGAPAAPGLRSAVWTGSEMIVWSRPGDLMPGAGGRYDPAADRWSPVTPAGAPSPRTGHTVVWTGTEMIIWGGWAFDGAYHYLNDGGRYDPVGNVWMAVNVTGAPSARANQTAVWTGSDMIVWGGVDGSNYPGTGGRYDPVDDSWTPLTTTGAPRARASHTAVWTGDAMIVWGSYANDGGRYNPANDTWTEVTTVDAPSARTGCTSVWSGSEMIVWGGYKSEEELNTGGRYDPVGNRWKPMVNALPDTPLSRYYHTAVWTGIEMIIWGGRYCGINCYYLDTGGRYNPASNTWTSVSRDYAPDPRAYHTAVWTGTEMIVWGGGLSSGGELRLLNSGGRYNPATDSWRGVNWSGAPSARHAHTAVWTGAEMIVWGGIDGGNTGGRYNPADNSWRRVNTTGTVERYEHTAVWTGSEMIVWGGLGAGVSNFLNDGERYNPSSDSWTAVPNTGSPSKRRWHTAVWTGKEMIIWGGDSGTADLNDGGRYDPMANSWTAVSGGAAGRIWHTAVWTGREMIVWGGYSRYGSHFGGRRYEPASDSWKTVNSAGAPPARRSHTAVWTGSEMIVWGGHDGSNYLNDVGRYTPEFEAFRITSAAVDSGNLTLTFPTLTGRTYTLWHSGTLGGGSWANTGLPRLTGTGAILTFIIPAPAATQRFFRVQAEVISQ